MKNRPLLLFLVCLALGALVWYDNRPADKPQRQAATPDPALQITQQPAGESEPAPSTDAVRPEGDNSEYATRDRAEQKSGDEAAPAVGDSGEMAPSPEATGANGGDSETPAGSETTPQPQSGNPLASLDKESLKDWVERPLFAPSRKRPPPAVAAQGPVPVAGAKPLPPTYELMGVVSEKGRAVALLRKKIDGTSFSVEVGDMVGGWQVSKVEPRSVVLVRGDGTSETVSLFRQ
jgi:hypothetical protein